MEYIEVWKGIVRSLWPCCRVGTLLGGVTQACIVV